MVRFVISMLLCMFSSVGETGLFWVSAPVHTNETVLVTGYFPAFAQLSIRAVKLSGRAGAWQSLVSEGGVPITPSRRSENNLAFVLPDLGGEGVYGFRVDQPDQNPLYGRVNLPEIWWQLSESRSAGAIQPRVEVGSAAPGGLLRLFGRCLTSTDPARGLQLTDAAGRSLRLKPSVESPYAVTFKLPDNIGPGSYSFYLDVAAGEGSRSEIRVLQVHNEQKPSLRTLNVKDFGGNADPEFDNSEALRAAMIKASELGGAVVAIPAGNYYFAQPITIPPGVYLKGESTDTTTLYFPDVDPPPDVWIQGAHHFGISDMSIFCGNHKTILSSDMMADASESGHIQLERLRIRGSSFMGHPTPEMASRRLALLIRCSGVGYETVRLSGKDLLIEGCELFGSGRSLYLYKAEGAIIRGNKLWNGAVGWYNFSGSEQIAFENNEIAGNDLLSSGGSYATARGESSRDIYTSNNNYSNMMGWDREAFTSDGGGGAYAGGVSTAQGERIEFPEIPKWNNWDWHGAAVVIVSGHGIGQWRTVKSWNGNALELSHSFQISPDSTSMVTIVPAQLHYVFYKNQFRDTGLATSFYGTAIEHIVAENIAIRAGGYYALAKIYAGGVAPELNIQFIGNQIRSGSSYHYGPNGVFLAGSSAIQATAIAPSSMIGLVLRNNILANGGVIRLIGSPAVMKGIMVEGNQFSDRGRDLQIDHALLLEAIVR